jgi:hypothetical protein
VSQRRPAGNRTTPARPAGTSTAVTIVLVVVTALLGLLILGKINDGSSSSGASTGGTTATTAPKATTTTTTTLPKSNMALAKVLVANGAGVKGLAGQYALALKQAFPPITLLPATDANAKYSASAVYYAAGFESQAGQIATSIGLKPAGLMPTTPPLKNPASLAGANVLVLLGTDKAGPVKVTAPTSAAGASTATTTTVAATTTTT